MKLFITSLLLAFLLVVNVANGRKYMGEYWGEKAIEALSDVSLKDGQKYSAGEYWGAKALETLNDNGQKFSGDHSFVKDFEHKPNQVLGSAYPTATKYFVKNFKLKSNLQWLLNEGTTRIHFVRDFVPKPNHVVHWHHGAASHDDLATPVKYFVNDFKPKPSQVLESLNGVASHDHEATSVKHFVNDFKPKTNQVLESLNGVAVPRENVWAKTIKTIVKDFEFN